jgi:site-specific recombinase XerD
LRRSPGTGSVYQPRYKAADGETRASRLYWIAYRVAGELKREPTHTADKRAAERLLRTRLSLVDRGEASTPAADRTTFEQLEAAIKADYLANGRRSAARVGQALAHLRARWGGTRAATWRPDAFSAYSAKRLEAGAARATICYELAVLKRMLRLGHRLGLVDRLPHVPMLQLRNARVGFFERADFERLRRALPADLRPPVLVAYLTGWRLTSEVLTRQWRHLDLQSGWLRLEPGETKGGEGRQFPLVPELRAALKAQRAATTKLERRLGRVVPWLFHTAAGEPLFYGDGSPGARYQSSAYFRAAWRAAAPDHIPHDFRRTATRQLLRAGVGLPAVMKMVGWETTAMLRRYAIADETMLREAGAKLARLPR